MGKFAVLQQQEWKRHQQVRSNMKYLRTVWGRGLACQPYIMVLQFDIKFNPKKSMVIIAETNDLFPECFYVGPSSRPGDHGTRDDLWDDDDVHCQCCM